MRLTMLSVLSIGALAVATPAHAQPSDGTGFRDFGTVCRVGAVRTCASVSIRTRTVYIDGVARYTEVTMSVANMQGTDASDNTGGSIITKVGLTSPDLVGASDLTVTGPIGAGDPASRWLINNKPIGGQVEFSAGLGTGAGTSNGTDGGILGCDPSDANPANYFQTCGSGAVVFTFRTSNIWTADNSEFAFKIQATDIDGNSYECRTEDTTGEHACTPSTIPEPVTTTLLATGLAGFGYIQRRRRKAAGANIEV